jgi:hypothetical protein
MADSIVYEHNSIVRNEQGEFDGSVKLVQFNGQTISVSLGIITESNNDDELQEQNCISITNLDTGKNIAYWTIGSVSKYFIPTPDLEVFMYSDTVMFIGMSGFDGNFTVWICDLVNMQLLIEWTFAHINKIIPIGNHHFRLSYRNSDLPAEIFTWSNLMHLDNLDGSVCSFHRDDRLFPVDWNSSSIDQFKSIVFVKTRAHLEQVEFLDRNFFPVMSLDVRTMFPDYQPISKEKFSKYFPGGENLCKYVTANANCLLYVELIQAVRSPWSDFAPGYINCYCWDFTTNSQVKFPSYVLNNTTIGHKARCFRDANGKIKYSINQENYQKQIGIICESV